MDDRYFKDPKIVGVTVGLLSFGIGAGVGYILGKRQRKFVEAVPAVIPWGITSNEVDPDWTLADLKSVDLDVEVKPPELPEVVETGKAFIEQTLEPVRSNVFDNVSSDDIWDWDKENSKRTETAPYVLLKDEFYNSETGYSQTTLTFYAGDEMMVDEEDKPIYNYAAIVGPLLFGHGSTDVNVFYVRNDKNHGEFEVIRDQGHYAVEVLGLEAEAKLETELEHSSDRKFRQD